MQEAASMQIQGTKAPLDKWRRVDDIILLNEVVPKLKPLLYII